MSSPHASAYTAATTTQKPAPIPGLMPLPDEQSPFFWSVIALNDDAEVQALRALRLAAVKKSPSAANHTTRIALIGAICDAESSTTKAFMEAQEAGVLLYTWRGSKALMPGPSARAKGGAA